ncbi:MAG TPA: single-stranded DNA-binding protein [Chloroflexota bacterium]|nr:single-stranded DNA-binding protein [Chloroflexota bacterium]
MLRVSLLGNLGNDPEVRYSAKGTQIVSFRVAVNSVRTGPDGERQENTEWFGIRVSGRQSEFVQRLGKGSRVLVIGRLDIGRYTTKDGETRPSFDVWADDIQSMTPRGSEPFGSADGDAETREAREPALAGAGVSSLNGGGQARPSSGSNGSSARATRGVARAESPPAGQAAAEDMEDLPF